MALIKCENVSIGYEGQMVVHDLNFEINQGDYLCIVGENGSGKSTLVKSLLGLKNVDKGKIVFDDGLKQTEIGYLPQQTVVQKDFPATVWEVVLSGTLASGGFRPFYRKKEKELARQKMEELDIWELKKKCYRNLSGGQQQRVLLARALCATSKVILLDEPVTGLDPKVTADFYELLKQLNNKGITVIMVSHDLHAVSYATHILYVDSEDSFYGTKKEFLNSDKADVLGKIKGDDK